MNEYEHQEQGLPQELTTGALSTTTEEDFPTKIEVYTLGNGGMEQWMRRDLTDIWSQPLGVCQSDQTDKKIKQLQPDDWPRVVPKE